MSRIGVITFPGTLDDVDAARAVERAGGEAVSLWHKDHDLQGVDAVVHLVRDRDGTRRVAGVLPDPGAVVGDEARLESAIVLEGGQVRAGARVTRSVVGRRARVAASTVLTDAALGTGEVAGA
mgnify:CR=1 FL=1